MNLVHGASDTSFSFRPVWNAGEVRALHCIGSHLNKNNTMISYRSFSVTMCACALAILSLSSCQERQASGSTDADGRNTTTGPGSAGSQPDSLTKTTGTPASGERDNR